MLYQPEAFDPLTDAPGTRAGYEARSSASSPTPTRRTPPRRCGRPTNGTRGRRPRRSRRSTSAPPASSGRSGRSSAAVMGRARSTSRRPRDASSKPGGRSPTSCVASSFPPPLAPGSSPAKPASSRSPSSWRRTTRSRTRSSSGSRRTSRTTRTNHVGLARHDARRARHARVDRRQRWADAWHESADELMRRREDDGSGRPASTARQGVASGLLMASSATCSHCAGGCRRKKRTSWNRTRPPRWRGAVVEDGCANWGRRLQWCSGAPGIVISAADYLDEELLLAGAELIWQAGPHGDEKGYGICHGTAGNGYALLKTFERTGDERWLQRARRFAVHALEQAEQLATSGGRRRYSLLDRRRRCRDLRGRLPRS